MYEELIAVHTVMRRGAALTAAATRALAAGEPVDVAELARLARWQTAFVHHHHASEDEQFWPVLSRLFPETVASLADLTEEHETLDTELRRLTAAVDRLAVSDPVSSVGIAALHAQPAAENVRDVLAAHLDNEEPVLKRLFPQVPDADITALRKAIVAGAPKSGPDLVLGLLQDPVPAPGHDTLMRNFPPPVRWLRPVLLRKYNARKATLRAS
jgi:hemerythrin-like domain-containing protein